MKDSKPPPTAKPNTLQDSIPLTPSGIDALRAAARQAHLDISKALGTPPNLRKSAPPPQAKPPWMSEQAWQEHQEEVRAFDKRNFRQSGGRLVGNHYPVSSPKQRWSLFSYLFGPRGKGR